MTDQTTEDIRSNWWMTHAATTLWFVLLYVIILSQAFLIDVSHTLSFFALHAWLFVYIVFSTMALFGFYYDKVAIADSGHEWAPAWWLYVLGSFILTPSFTSFLYLLQRARHIGIHTFGRRIGPTLERT